MLPAFPDRPIPERLHMTLDKPYSAMPGRSSETGGAEYLICVGHSRRRFGI